MTDIDNEKKLISEIEELKKRNQELEDKLKLYTNPERNKKYYEKNCEIVKEDFRMVNGKKVFFMQMNGTTQGIKFTYLGYYYSNQSGTFQFVTYTAQNLLAKAQTEMFELLNGVVVP